MESILHWPWGGLLSERAGPAAGSVAAAPRSEPEASLASRAALGDREAFGRLYDRHAAEIGRLCRRLLDTAEDAEDARHEVFLKAQEAFAGYDRSRSLRSWLLVIASHHCIDRLRRARLEGRLFADRELGTEDLPDRGPGPLGAALLRERRGELLAALDALPARYRAVLGLRYFAELPYAEIAELLEISHGQVGVVLHRAKARLRQALAGRGERP
jgi:RNA polymerase sigma-70 factor (ECF subfamily)